MYYFHNGEMSVLIHCDGIEMGSNTSQWVNQFKHQDLKALILRDNKQIPLITSMDSHYVSSDKNASRTYRAKL